LLQIFQKHFTKEHSRTFWDECFSEESLESYVKSPKKLTSDLELMNDTETNSKKRKSKTLAEQERKEKIRILNESNKRHSLDKSKRHNQDQSDIMLFSFNLIKYQDFNKKTKKMKTKLEDRSKICSNHTRDSMQKNQFRLIHQNIELAKQNEILKKKNETDNETILKLKHEIDLLGAKFKDYCLGKSNLII
jgi:hypothetical protein